MNLLACPLGSPGFAFPVIAIAERAAARGHRVDFLTAPWLGPLLRGVGFVHTPCAGFDTRAWHDPRAIAAQFNGLESRRPDVILTSALALGPLLAGERLGVPVVVVGLLTDLLQQREAFAAAWDGARAVLGFAGAPVERLLGDVYLQRGIPGLVAGPHLVGECAWEPPLLGGARDWLAAAARDGATVAYASPARSFGGPGFWEHLGGLPAGVRVAASIARLDQAGAAPAGALVAPLLPQRAMLAQAAVAIISGSTAAAAGAMAAGVPLVVVPDGGEGPAIAALVERAGVGVTLPAAAVTPARLGAAFEAARHLDPAPRQALRQAFAAIDGPGVAMSRIEGL